VLVALPRDGIARARRELDVLPAGSVVAAHGTQLIAVTPAEDPGNLLDGTLSATVGVAGPATGPVELAACYRDAADTANALLTLGKEGQVSTAAQLGIYRVLLNHTGREELRTQYDQLLGAVVQAQNRRKVPLLRTLRSYLDSGRRLAQTAEQLGIHVNTLYQRLAHLDELLGASWREPPRALDLQILLRVNPPPD
jgi:DNA-binding PucR family transcriptional regulator